MGPIERGEFKSYLLEFRDNANQLASLASIAIEVRVTTRAGEVTRANTAGGGSDDEIEDVSTGIVRLKFSSAFTSALEPGLLRGQVWITEPGEEARKIGSFTTNVL